MRTERRLSSLRSVLLVVLGLLPGAVAGAAPASPWSCEAATPKEGRALMTEAAAVARARPAKGAAYEDPAFHTCVVRATDHAREGITTFVRHDYSRRQAFNVDSSLFLTSAHDGGWHLYDARTLKHVKGLPGLQGDAEPQWHPSEPNTLYFGERNGGLIIRAIDVRSNKIRVVADLHGKLPWPTAARAWSKSEGSPSRDGRYWALQVETDGFEILGYATWDMQQNKLVGSLPVRERPDHVSISPSGRWFVSSADEGGTTAWSLDFKKQKQVHKRTEHSDLAIGANGHDYFVSVDYQSNEGFLFMVDIDTGERTDLIRTYISGSATAIHFSGKAFDRPGWVLLSTYARVGAKRWYTDKVFAMELRANPRFYPLAEHHSDVRGEYFAEPQATVNRDFTRVLFNSNWGGVPSDIDAYMIRLPAAAIR